MAGQTLAVGVDLGGTNVRAGVVDSAGVVRFAARSRIDDRAPEATVSLTSAVVREVLEGAGLGMDEVAGVGIGVAAQLRKDTGVVAVGPNLGWREVPFGRMLAASLGRPVKVVNDVEAITWAEVQFGAARGHPDALVVFVGTGVGGGLVLDGKLYRGASGVAAEIGHVKVRQGGDRCGCGKRGCLEAYLGGANLSRRLRLEAERGWPALLEKAGSDLESIHPGLLQEMVHDGDRRAIELFRQLAGYLGLTLANAVTLLNPSVLVLGGTVWEGCPTLQQWSLQVFRQLVLSVAEDELEIRDAALGDNAGVIGAASLVMVEGVRTAF